MHFGKEPAEFLGKKLKNKIYFPYSCFRERYLNFVCSLDLVDVLQMTTLHNLLKANLAKAEMLTYLFVFNAPSWVEELDFVFGKIDAEEWNVSIS